MILLLNETCRLGEEESILIRTRPQYAPWLIAFIKWSLGPPPFVQLATGRVLIDQERPHVLLIITSLDIGDTPDLQISPAYRQKSLRSLVVEGDNFSSTFYWDGLMKVDLWMNYTLKRLFNSFPELNNNHDLLMAAGQALVFIVSILPDRLVLSELELYTETSHPNQFAFRCTEFPDVEERMTLTQELLGTSIPIVWQGSVSEQILQPDYIGKIINEESHSCQQQSFPDEVHRSKHNRARDFLECIARLGADLLVLSLFGITTESFPMICPGS